MQANILQLILRHNTASFLTYHSISFITTSVIIASIVESWYENWLNFLICPFQVWQESCTSLS